MKPSDGQLSANLPIIEDMRLLGDPTAVVLPAVKTKADEERKLALKLQLVNDAIDEIGFTSYQLKLFFLNGFGYAVDSLVILLNSLTQPQVAMQYRPVISKAQTIAVGIGLLFGALFWGLGADVSVLDNTQRWIVS